MNPVRYASPLASIPGYILAVICIAILWIPVSCRTSHHHRDHPVVDSIENSKISWNILFEPGTDQATRDKVINDLRDYVRQYYNDYNAIHGTNYHPKDTNAISCPCDPLLNNIDFSPVDGAGKSVVMPPPTTPPGGSGDFLRAVVSFNSPIIDRRRGKDTVVYNADSVKLRPGTGVDTSKKFAIIDSGIDPALFTSDINNLIWVDPAGTSTVSFADFIPGQFNRPPLDETSEKHGSAVAAIVVKTLDNNATPKYPRLLILKALDSSNRGSIFSVSCALSYATQKQATIVNLSLGYYGDADSILHHYLGIAATARPSIDIFAAAGNTKDDHIAADLCKQRRNNNRLGRHRLFYPACFSEDFGNITSVTQMSNDHSPCFYQNYSPRYISMGLYDTSNCCAIKVDYHTNDISFYEGSSFATPAASALKMATILTGRSWNNLIKFDRHKRVAVKGKYVYYSN